jgi:hypothetical protein
MEDGRIVGIGEREERDALQRCRYNIFIVQQMGAIDRRASVEKARHSAPSVAPTRGRGLLSACYGAAE